MRIGKKRAGPDFSTCSFLVKQKKDRDYPVLFLCAGEDLNLHGSRHMALNHACLPVPAPAQAGQYYNRLRYAVKQQNRQFWMEKGL